MRRPDAYDVAALPRFARLRTIAPLVLICSEQSFADSTLDTWCDLVVVRREGMEDDAQIAQAVGGWWRRQLGIQFAAAMRADLPLAVGAVRTIFESKVVPCDTGALARIVGCSREHLARELERSLRGAFTAKVILDMAITMELFSRMGVGQSWLEVARDFHVTRRTLRRTMQRVAVALGCDIRDFRSLLVAVQRMLQ